MRRLALLLLVLAATLGFVRIAGHLLVVADALPPRATAIVILAGSTADRVLEAATLYEAGIAPLVVLTQEQQRPELVALARRGVVLPESHEVARDALVALGVPDDAIDTLRGRAWSTSSEVALIGGWACTQPTVPTLVVITSPSHTRRSRMILQRGLGAAADVRVRPTQAAFFPAERWWRHRHVAKRVFLEYQKLINFWLVERWMMTPCDVPASDQATAARIRGSSSPRACISRTTSQPPTNWPPTNT